MMRKKNCFHPSNRCPGAILGVLLGVLVLVPVFAPCALPAQSLEEPPADPAPKAETRSYQVDSLNVTLTPEAEATLESAELLMDDADLLTPQTEERLRQLLVDAQEDYSFSLYVHIVPSTEITRLYPQLAVGLLRAKLFTSSGGVLVLTERPLDLLNVYSNLTELQVGKEELKRVNAAALEEAALAEGVEPRLASHIETLLGLVLVRLQAARPESSSSAPIAFDLPSENAIQSEEAPAEKAVEPVQREDSQIPGFVLGVVVGLLGMIIVAAFFSRKNSGKRRRVPGSRESLSGERPHEAAPVALKPKFSPGTDSSDEDQEEAERFAKSQEALLALLDEARRDLPKTDSRRPLSPAGRAARKEPPTISPEDTRVLTEAFRELLQALPVTGSRRSLGRCVEKLNLHPPEGSDPSDSKR